MPNPTLLAALGAPSLLALVPLTQHQPNTPPTFQLPQSSYGNGLILSPAEAPVPQKIVDKIRSGQFVEMRELLADNISLLEQLHRFHALRNISAAGPSRPRMRDVLTLSSWLYCFYLHSSPHHRSDARMSSSPSLVVRPHPGMRCPKDYRRLLVEHLKRIS